MADPVPADRPSIELSLSVPHKDRERRITLLPDPVTSFVGREREVEAVADLLRSDHVRLVMLIGPGGVGKTRLALRLAGDLAADFDEVAFVGLSSLLDPVLVVPTVAQAFGVREVAGRPLSETLAHALRERHLLLVLDNFEQVVTAASDLTALLARCPRLTILVTSRASLRVRAEYEHPVAPLPLSQAGVEAGMPSPAVALFVERARSVRPEFDLTDANARTVAEICRRLDGLPLAIELAAARVKVLSPQALLARLTDRLRLLTGGARDLPDRQQTMRGAIAWSHDLLVPEEQVLFRRLAVFAGGFTLEAAEAVVPAAGDLGIDVLEGVASLVDKSLVRRTERPGDEPRFGMLETVREYARDRLAESDEQAAVQSRHLGWCLALAEAAEPELRSAGQGTWLGRLETEHDNVRAALTWAGEGVEPESRALGLRLAASLYTFWFVRSHWAEGREWLEELLRTDDSRPSAARAKALFVAGLLAFAAGDPAAAAARHEESLGMARAVGSRTVEALALYGLGDAARLQGDASEAGRCYEAALALFQDLDDRAWIG
ncbi:MAG: AAA family ATPase, partial [Chloroflexota bacterium]|nr:AAA family ATPase [Chloroflexota bacterium]